MGISARNAAHAFAATTVTAALSAYGLSGGVQTEYGPPFVVLGAAALAGVSGALTSLIVNRQRRLRKRDLVRPVGWALVIAWAASLYLLLSHPASLRTGRPVVSSVLFAGMLVAPFAAYWGVYHLVERGMRDQDGVA